MSLEAAARWTSPRLPRRLHPGAWWLWALGIATAAARTTNPLLLLLAISVAAFVVASRRADTPWARAFKVYLIVGAVVVTVRVVFRMLVGGIYGEHLLFTLPTVPLPGWAAGIVIGGPVTVETLLAAFYDGLRLATLLICVGAANALADPKRLLRIVPRAVHDVGASIVVALSLAPQIIQSFFRVRRARRLRGAAGGRIASLRATVVPVLEDGVDRSLALAAAMDARGYGRVSGDSSRRHRTTGVLMLSGLVGICLGLYGLLDASASAPFVGMPAMVFGVALAVAGLVVGGRRIQRSVYRPDPWEAPEWAVAATGAIAAVATIAGGIIDPAGLHPSLQPLVWPALPLLPALGLLAAAAPAVLAPPAAARRVVPAEAPLPRMVASDPLR